jgi:hypothetical protein
MKWACPKCSRACGIFQGKCPGCGLPLHLWSVLKFYWRRISEKLSMATSLRCPKCGFANPIKTSFCGQCKSHLSVGLATEQVVQRPRNRWHQFLREVTPQTRRRIQWTYLIFSAASLWWLLAYVENNGGTTWPLYMALSIIYVAVLAFFGLWLIPRLVFINVSRRSPPLVKLALALNGLSLMLLVQLFIKEWWVRALTLAGLFVVAWLGSWVLQRIILTRLAETEAMFLDTPRSDGFDPSDPQGRTARVD